MALQTLTTTVTNANGQSTSTQTNVSDDTNANSNLLGPNGPTPLVPAFLLSGLLVVGIVMMCWWKRFAARRVAGVRLAGGMFVLEGSGSGTQGGNGGKINLGPQPRIWDLHLADEDLKEVRWVNMNPISACYIQHTPQASSDLRTISSNGTALPSYSSHDTHKEASSPSGFGSNLLRSPLNSPPPPILRVSVLISMPTNSDSKSAQKGSGLDDCNLALGTAKISMVKNVR